MPKLFENKRRKGKVQMIIKIIKWIGIVVSIITLIVGFFFFNTFSQFDKLGQGQLQADFTQDTIPFRYNHTGHILIDVKINNSDISYPFILDSGANNYVFKNFTKEHPLEGNGFAFGIGAVGNMYFTRIRKIQSLQIGKARFNTLNADESSLNWDCMDNVYGLIGPSIMKHLVWDIDFQKQIIVLSKHLDNKKRDDHAIEIPLINSDFIHYLDIYVKFRHNRISKRVRIDLGNAGTLSLAENLLIEDTLNFKKKKVFGVGSKGLGYASSNSSSDNSYYLVDSLIFNNAEYAISNIPVKASPKSFNFLGLDFFKKYKMTLSWHDKVMILTPYDKLQNFVSKTYGFSTGYNEQQNRVEVESITENTSASKAGLPLFSEVISINQQTFTNSKSYCEYIESEQMGDTMNIEIKYKDSIQRFKLTKELLFDLEANKSSK